MGAAQWGSQSWLQPAFSRPSAEHEGSLTAQEPPERRPQRGPPGHDCPPHTYFRVRLRLVHRRSDFDFEGQQRGAESLPLGVSA